MALEQQFQTLQLNACQDVQTTIITLSAIVTGPIGIATLSSLPAENVGTYSTGVAKCFRDLKYIVDGVAQDIAYDTNQHTVRNTKFYFDAQGNQKLMVLSMKKSLSTSSDPQWIT